MCTIKKNLIKIPFIMNERSGWMQVEYQANTSVEESGFDVLRHKLPFPAEKCLGFPTMRAWVDQYEGTGYYTASAWIQLIRSERWVKQGHSSSRTIQWDLDTNPAMVEAGVPFFAQGYPAVIYDAPCGNLVDDDRLDWQAETYFVTMPSPINDFTITALAGFRWGCVEWQDGSDQRVAIHDLQTLGQNHWQRRLPWLQEQCPTFQFSALANIAPGS